MEELVLDVIEQILVRLDVIDLLRCKSVCKSWFSLISSHLFVKTHLKYSCSINYHLPDRRIMMHADCGDSRGTNFKRNDYHIVGSSNGLVCISPKDVELLVINPLTREVNYLPALPNEIIPKTNKPRLSCSCLGFGYDASSDDYTVIVGFGVGKYQTCFHVLTLKSNIWKLIGDIKYKLDCSSGGNTHGILCEGSLHWLMNDRENKKAIISIDLSRQEFNEIPQPDDLVYKCDHDDSLGFTKGSLCIYKRRGPIKTRLMIWIMRSYQVKQSWEQAPYPCDEMDVDPHYLRRLKYITHKSSSYCGSLRFMDYMATPVFVPSLVSPPGKIHRLIKKTNDKRALKRKRGHAKNRKKNVESIKKGHDVSIKRNINWSV